jgi:hypothetical protein
MDMKQALALGYQYAIHGGKDPAPEAAKALSRAEINAELVRMVPLLERDHISRVRTTFLERVIALTPPA